MDVSFWVEKLLIPGLIGIVVARIYWYIRPVKDFSRCTEGLEEISGKLSKIDMKVCIGMGRLEDILLDIKKAADKGLKNLERKVERSETVMPTGVNNREVDKADGWKEAYFKVVEEARSISAALARSNAFDADLFGEKERYRERIISELRQSNLLKDTVPVKKKRRGRPPKKKV